MSQIPEILHQQGYKSIPFRVTKTQHLVLYAKINGVRGRFILDTGASNSCLGFEGVEKFHVQTQHSSTKAAGAGATGLHTEQSVRNVLQLGRWKNRHFSLIVLDLTHVNTALQHYKVKPVDGIIGADVLLEGQALIDYKMRQLFLL
jgi:hypothetical protein